MAESLRMYGISNEKYKEIIYSIKGLWIINILHEY